MDLYRGGRRERVGIRGVIHATSPTLATQLAVAGEGIVRTTEWLVRRELRDGSLVVIMRAWSCDNPARGGVPIYVMYSVTGASPPPRKARVFVDMIKRIMESEVDTARADATRRR
jgi:DNA-binding transcriptional LysR family regulator